VVVESSLRDGDGPLSESFRSPVSVPRPTLGEEHSTIDFELSRDTDDGEDDVLPGTLWLPFGRSDGWFPPEVYHGCFRTLEETEEKKHCRANPKHFRTSRLVASFTITANIIRRGYMRTQGLLKVGLP